MADTPATGSRLGIAGTTAFWEIAAALAVIAWRLTWYPLERSLHDGIAVLAAYWIFVAVGHRSRALKPVTLVLLVALLAIYAGHQVPFIMDMLRFAV